MNISDFSCREGTFVYHNDIPRILSQSSKPILTFDTEKQESLKSQLMWFDEQTPNLKVAKQEFQAVLRSNNSPALKKIASVIYQKNLDMFADHLHDLNESASWLFRNGHIDKANAVFEKALAWAHEFIPAREITATLSSNLGSLLIETDEHERGAELLQASIIKDRGGDGKIERLCVSTYRLATYRMNQNRVEEAQALLYESKTLRATLFSADSVEMERIKMMEASILSRSGHFDEAEALLKGVFERRKGLDRFGLDLIPVLEQLIIIAEEKKHEADECSYRIHLKDIYQRHFGEADLRTILANFKLMNSFQYHAPQEDLDVYLFKAEEWMSQFPVNRESSLVGLCYAELAYATYNRQFFSQEMPLDQKKELISKAWIYSLKACRHLQATKTLDLRSLGLIKKFEKDCLDTSQFLENVSHFSNEPGLMGPVFYHQDEEKVEQDPLQLDSQTKNELAVLSEFSSEIDYTKIQDQDRPLTVEDFHDLPSKGRINPYRLRVAQGGITKTFANGMTITEMRDRLSADPSYAREIPPVEVGIHHGKIYSFDTRRLIAHMMAKRDNEEVFIRYTKIEGKYLEERIKTIFCPRPWNGYVTAIRHGGKGSESEPFICPPLEIQLTEAVEKGFRRFPKDRKNADLNGFLPKLAAAKKIRNFLISKLRLSSPSQLAKEIFEESEQIRKSDGVAANQFLIEKRQTVLAEMKLKTAKELDLNAKL